MHAHALASQKQAIILAQARMDAHALASQKQAIILAQARMDAQGRWEE